MPLRVVKIRDFGYFLLEYFRFQTLLRPDELLNIEIEQMQGTKWA
jgi:hypothetical protein